MRYARRIAELESQVARLTAELAEANATIRTLINSGLAADDATDNLVHILARNVEGLQQAVDIRDEDLEEAVDMLGRQDEHISDLQREILREPRLIRQ